MRLKSDRPIRGKVPARLSQIRIKKHCLFCEKKLGIDYKDIELLSRFVSSKGKIISRRSSGTCAKHQRKLAKEIKRARFICLLPYWGG